MEGPHLLLLPTISNLVLTSICKGLQNFIEPLGVKSVFFFKFYFIFLFFIFSINFIFF